MKAISLLLVSIGLILYPLKPSLALPEGESVETGTATFERPNETTLNIVADDKTVINFNSFNIAQDEAVNFLQPQSTAAVLSRITGGAPTYIEGGLSPSSLFLL
jgi:large exoprotein involved in heme utilization and adhesion